MSFHVVFYGLKGYFGLNISLHCTKMIVSLVEVLIMSLKLWNTDHDGGGCVVKAKIGCHGFLRGCSLHSRSQISQLGFDNQDLLINLLFYAPRQRIIGGPMQDLEG
jgi:hypothetical protein